MPVAAVDDEGLRLATVGVVLVVVPVPVDVVEKEPPPPPPQPERERATTNVARTMCIFIGLIVG